MWGADSKGLAFEHRIPGVDRDRCDRKFLLPRHAHARVYGLYGASCHICHAGAETVRRKHDDATFDRGNTEAAGIILERPAVYGPGLVEWATRWQAAHPPKVKRWQRPAVATVGTAEGGEQMALGFDESKANGINTLGPGSPPPQPGVDRSCRRSSYEENLSCNSNA